MRYLLLAAFVIGCAAPGWCQSSKGNPKEQLDNSQPWFKKDPYAEEKGSRAVKGTVRDANDNPIQGAIVSIKNLKNGRTYSYVTRQDGAYQFDQLNDYADYELQALHQGIKSQIRKFTTLDPRRKAVFNFRIEPPAEAKEETKATPSS